jgi:hypothetical protein
MSVVEHGRSLSVVITDNDGGDGGGDTTIPTFLEHCNQSPLHGASIRIVRYGHLLILQKGKFSMFVDISDLVRRQLQTMRRCWRD